MLPGHEEYLRAFNELSGDRQMGGPIMFLSIERWAERNGMASQDDFAGLLAALSVIDEEYRRNAGNSPQGRPMTPELFDAVFG